MTGVILYEQSIHFSCEAEMTETYTRRPLIHVIIDHKKL